MGWSKGKGLGIKEDGEQNFIRVAHKIDQKGMGYHDRDDQWTSHENQFNSLLKSLDNPANTSDDNDSNKSDEEVARVGFGFSNGETSSKKPKTIKSKLSGNSLEEMSKNSGVRVHYRKFTRGKDTSRYSEKDLANIFGKKTGFEEETQAPMEQSNFEEKDSENGITTIETGTTIQDYFKKKKNPRGTLSQESADEQIPSDPIVEKPEKKKRKKDKKSNAEAVIPPNEIETIEIDQSPPPKKDKKRKKSKKEPIEVETIVVSEEDSDCEILSIKEKKKKKKSKKEKPSECAGIVEITNDTANDESLVDTVEKVPKKKKKSGKKKEPIETTITETEVNPIESKSISNTQFIDGILDILVSNNQSAPSSTALNSQNADSDDDDDDSNNDNRSQQTTQISTNIAMDEVFEINRYHAEMFRFVNLDGFPNANLSDLSGYGYSKEIELKVSEKSKDQTKINDLWDYALINKYGKEVIQAKKAKRYSMKHLKKKNLFMAL